MGRRAAFLFIHIFVAIQLAVPLLYYVARKDKLDERFAWRMFSPTRMVTCGSGNGLRSPPVFAVDGKPEQLGRRFHEAWVNLTKRGRLQIVEAVAQTLCDENPGKPVRVSYACREVDGNVVSVAEGNWDFCKTGAM